MRSLVKAVKGLAGRPLHPPLTDASIGAYTVGVAMLVLGALGVEEEQMAHGALLAIGGGLVLALPTGVTGLLDWAHISQGTPADRTAIIHIIAMLVATTLFAFAFVAQMDGYDAGEVRTLALLLGLLAEAVLAVGGYVGGTLVFHYGVRVLKRTETPTSEALIPGSAPSEPEREVQDDVAATRRDRLPPT